LENKAEQFYPTYKAEHRDILLLEFEESHKIANSQTKVYGQMTNILLAIATFIFTFLLDEGEKKDKALSFVLSNSVLFVSIMFLFGAILLRYFVDLQKQITTNARKAITLRTLLGLDYGTIHLTIPNWRVEGATNPFVIKYFSGWLRFETMPFWLLTISVNSLWAICAYNKELTFDLYNYAIIIKWWWGHLFITAIYFYIFRINLNDRHETFYLTVIKRMCSLLRIRLVDNFEYILYRAKLSYLELDRLKVEYKVIKQVLIDIEDVDFKKNRGVSFKAIVRGFLSRFKFFRTKYGYIQNGGSTITMQLARSLFIPANQNKYRRKIAELLLSLWLNHQFQKEEILKIYIASVRFERGVIGLSNAIKHFFGTIKSRTLSNEEAFFLVERLSNVSSTVNFDRIKHLIKRTSLQINESELQKIYARLMSEGKLQIAQK